jgi:ornithine carbamoyltransferase
MQHFIDLFDCSGEQIRKLLKEAARLKKNHLAGKNKPALQGRVLGLIFEKPSLRTRVSFEAAMAHMGGASIFIAPTDGPLGKREALCDFARVISQFVDAVVLRTFKHDTVVQFAQYASCHVINGLSDCYHPCQALGDLLTLREEFGTLEGKTLVFIGDGNNVARSLAIGCGKVGTRFILASPPRYGFDQGFLDKYREAVPEGELIQEHDPAAAAAKADIIYTDVWTSMGQEAETDQRRRDFAAYQVNGELLKKAPRHAKVMHCLPAHREEEVTHEVMDGPQSLVYEQAGNRMHAQKALLLWLMEKGARGEGRGARREE